EKYADRIFLFNEGKLIDANEIVEGFSKATIKTIRVKNMDEQVKKRMKMQYPSIEQQTLVSEMTLLHLPSSEPHLLSDLTTFLVEHQVMDFAFGKVTLNDLYALYYHEVV
ncbi:MAG TPA: ABC transporter ATP-binding protein, partial [Solibacillus sp.]